MENNLQQTRRGSQQAILCVLLSPCVDRDRLLKDVAVVSVVSVHLVLERHLVVPGFPCPFYDYSSVLS